MFELCKDISTERTIRSVIEEVQTEFFLWGADDTVSGFDRNGLMKSAHKLIMEDCRSDCPLVLRLL